ncbi:MAG: hypothetical protein WD206_10140 [Actinomycetota bacterium]
MSISKERLGTRSKWLAAAALVGGITVLAATIIVASEAEGESPNALDCPEGAPTSESIFEFSWEPVGLTPEEAQEWEAAGFDSPAGFFESELALELIRTPTDSLELVEDETSTEDGVTVLEGASEESEGRSVQASASGSTMGAAEIVPHDFVVWNDGHRVAFVGLLESNGQFRVESVSQCA